MTTNEPIDFTAWTDAQLEVGARFDPSAQAEIDRRQAEGIWKADGSHERIADMIARNPGMRPRKPRRPRVR